MSDKVLVIESLDPSPSDVENRKKRARTLVKRLSRIFPESKRPLEYQLIHCVFNERTKGEGLSALINEAVIELTLEKIANTLVPIRGGIDLLASFMDAWIDATYVVKELELLRELELRLHGEVGAKYTHSLSLVYPKVIAKLEYLGAFIAEN